MAIYSLDLHKTALEAVPTSPFATLDVQERKHLQRALLDKIEAIAPGTMVLTEEFGHWEDSRRRIDLLCLDEDRRLVVVELKRSEDGGHMELQALRYAAMVSAMTFQQAVDAHAAFLAKRNQHSDDAEVRIRQFLDIPEGPVTLSTAVRIVLASGDFDREITTAVLWLNAQGLDITCVRMRPHKSSDRILLDIQQVLPLPEAQEYQVAIREKANQQAKAEASGRDFTKFEVTSSFGTFTGLPKRRFLFEVVREAVKQGRTPEQIAEAIPWRRDSIFLRAAGTLSGGQLMDQFPDRDSGRYFVDDEELFHSNGATYAMSNQWGNRTEEAAKNVIALLPVGAVTYKALAKS
ncbi:hypothetical protein [Ramlibacter sp. AN1133]|uniref:hypothetical protein n=1 Tax=Ramlibacter sp. AN1133 TaxID=3133429 RepID=UPI0030BDB630